MRAIFFEQEHAAAELLADELDGWLDTDDPRDDGPLPAAPPLDLPTSPQRCHRSPSD